MILLMTALWMFQALEWHYKLDEVEIARFLASSGQQHYAMVYFMGRTPGAFRIFCYDLEKEQGRFIKDGRLRPMRPVIVAHDGRFILLDKAHKSMPIGYVIDPRQGFLDQLRIYEFENWESDFMFHDLGYTAQNHPILIFSRASSPQNLLTAQLDLTAKTLSLAQSYKLQSDSERLALFGNHAILYNRQTASIKKLPEKMLHSGKPAITKKQSGFNRTNAKVTLNVITGTHLTPDRLQLEYSDYYFQGPEVADQSQRKIIRLDKEGTLSYQSTLLIHQYQNKLLVFDLESNTLQITRE